VTCAGAIWPCRADGFGRSRKIIAVDFNALDFSVNSDHSNPRADSEMTIVNHRKSYMSYRPQASLGAKPPPPSGYVRHPVAISGTVMGKRKPDLFCRKPKHMSLFNLTEFCQLHLFRTGCPVPDTISASVVPLSTHCATPGSRRVLVFSTWMSPTETATNCPALGQHPISVLWLRPTSTRSSPDVAHPPRGRSEFSTVCHPNSNCGPRNFL
jgi:hypothetical protein